ncbi:MAG: hypothetical protein AB7U20_07800 [Planctomycetaceae bacterium]
MTPVLRCRDGVVLTGLAPGGLRIIAALDIVCQRLGKDLWITSAVRENSAAHARGTAIDVSVVGDYGKKEDDLTPTEIVALVQNLRVNLGSRFTVLFEMPTMPKDPSLRLVVTINPKATAPHVHVQVRKGTEFP